MLPFYLSVGLHLFPVIETVLVNSGDCTGEFRSLCMCLLAEVDDTYSQHIKSKMYLLGAMLHCYDTVHTESRHTRDEYSNHTDYAGYTDT